MKFNNKTMLLGLTIATLAFNALHGMDDEKELFKNGFGIIKTKSDTKESHDLYVIKQLYKIIADEKPSTDEKIKGMQKVLKEHICVPLDTFSHNFTCPLVSHALLCKADIPVLLFLLAQGASVTQTDIHGIMPLTHALRTQNKEAVLMLLDCNELKIKFQDLAFMQSLVLADPDIFELVYTNKEKLNIDRTYLLSAFLGVITSETGSTPSQNIALNLTTLIKTEFSKPFSKKLYLDQITFAFHFRLEIAQLYRSALRTAKEIKPLSYTSIEQAVTPYIKNVFCSIDTIIQQLLDTIETTKETMSYDVIQEICIIIGANYDINHTTDHILLATDFTQHPLFAGYFTHCTRPHEAGLYVLKLISKRLLGINPYTKFFEQYISHINRATLTPDMKKCLNEVYEFFAETYENRPCGEIINELFYVYPEQKSIFINSLYTEKFSFPCQIYLAQNVLCNNFPKTQEELSLMNIKKLKHPHVSSFILGGFLAQLHNIPSSKMRVNPSNDTNRPIKINFDTETKTIGHDCARNILKFLNCADKDIKLPIHLQTNKVITIKKDPSCDLSQAHEKGLNYVSKL